MEVHSCQTPGMAQTFVDISGNDITGGTGMGNSTGCKRILKFHVLGFRMEPAVNLRLIINSNQFQELNNSALLIRNSRHPQLKVSDLTKLLKTFNKLRICPLKLRFTGT